MYPKQGVRYICKEVSSNVRILTHTDVIDLKLVEGIFSSLSTFLQYVRNIGQLELLNFSLKNVMVLGVYLAHCHTFACTNCAG